MGCRGCRMTPGGREGVEGHHVEGHHGRIHRGKQPDAHRACAPMATSAPWRRPSPHPWATSNTQQLVHGTCLSKMLTPPLSRRLGLIRIAFSEVTVSLPSARANTHPTPVLPYTHACRGPRPLPGFVEMASSLAKGRSLSARSYTSLLIYTPQPHPRHSIFTHAAPQAAAQLRRDGPANAHTC